MRAVECSRTPEDWSDCRTWRRRPNPLQVLPGGHSASGSWPAGMGAQMPTEPGRSHLEHSPAHAELQQTRRRTRHRGSPLRRSMPSRRRRRTSRRHCHAWPAGHSASGSCPRGSRRTCPESPPGCRSRHVPVQEETQQTLSAQKPLAQSEGEEQVAPAAAAHAPAPLQVCPEGHS